MNSRDAEREELERAIELLGRRTRPGRLLEYLGAKYLEQPEQQLSEFTIATDVFGRSEKNFDSTQDAVVRVEAHRLRKKLRDLYEKDDRAQGLQVSLPAGTYHPKFTAIPEPRLYAKEAVSAANDPADAPSTNFPPAAKAARRVPAWAWYLGGVAVIAIAIFAALHRDSPPTRATPAQAAQTAASPASTGELTDLHIMAGYGGSDVIDNSGIRWSPDRYFQSGGQWQRDSGFIRGTSRPFLFANWRSGEFSYDVPMAPGTYEMRLYFISPFRAGDEKLAGFNVALNGKTILDAFDINFSANGADVADEQVFRDVTPDKDGRVRLWFSNQVGSPMLSALELAPGTPGKLKPIRILTQPNSFVDHQGQRWRADDYFQNGFHSNDRRKVIGTEDPELFAAERFGHFSYAIPVDRRGRYTLVLHFAEFYYGPQLPGGGGAGRRIFNVFCNGQTLLKNFDIYQEGGSLRVVTKSFPHIEPSAQGKINLMFEPVINNATVSGIEILDES